MGKTTRMTPSLQGWLKHLRNAERQGAALTEYARSAGVKVGSLYEAKRRLVRLGVLGQVAAASGRPATKGEFLPVVVERPRSAPAAAATSGAVCRLRTPSGWVIECADWPPAIWMAGLMSGGCDDSP
jgi:hypothetical protein